MRVSVANKTIYQVDVNAISVQKRKETGEELFFCM